MRTIRRKSALLTTLFLSLYVLIQSTALAQPKWNTTSADSAQTTDRLVYVAAKPVSVSAKPVKPAPDTTAYITTGNVYFRTGPSSADPIIDYLLKSTPVTLVSKYSSTWYQVYYSGKTGLPKLLPELVPIT